MNLNNKIQKILDDKNVSSSQFADEIGVTRSSISHILTGRNKPSLDMIQKVIGRYPELGTSWILDSEPLPTIIKDLSKNSINTLLENNTEKVTLEKKYDIDDNSSTSKVVDRVMIFYSDGTFNEFKPSL